MSDIMDRRWVPGTSKHRSWSDSRARGSHRRFRGRRQLSPLLKQNVIHACADCVIHDGKVTAAEGELLQAIALNLDCPLPPLIEQAG